MRVAVALPTLPPDAPHRERLDAALAALVEAGIEIEAFAERPRDRDGEDPFPVFHYLRLHERQERGPFDTGLVPLGRDMRAWEPAYLQMHACPGAVWVLDPVVHHLLIGGLLAWGQVSEYRDTLEAEFGEQSGAIMAHTVAGGWGIDSLYRERDPLMRRCARQPAACGATPAIVGALERAGATAPLVPLPAPETGHRAPGSPGSSVRLFVLRMHYSWPQPALRGLGTVLRERPDVELVICVPQVIRTAGLRFPYGYEWLEQRIRWVDPGDWDGLSAAADSSDMVIHLLSDPTVGERALIERAMARGSVPLLLGAPGSVTYGPEATIRIEPGRGQERALALAVEELLVDRELRQAVGTAARRAVADRPGPGAVARALLPVLERAAASGFHKRNLSSTVWRALERSVRTKVGPASAPGEHQRLIDSRWKAVTPPRPACRSEEDGA